jgi:hypothetical protein
MALMEVLRSSCVLMVAQQMWEGAVKIETDQSDHGPLHGAAKTDVQALRMEGKHTLHAIDQNLCI